jgi:hypothetical protein
MRKDVREFIRRLEAVGLTVEPTPGHYRVLRDGKPLRKANGMPLEAGLLPTTRTGRGHQARFERPERVQTANADWGASERPAARRASSVRAAHRFP